MSTKNQRQWKVKPLEDSQVNEWLAQRKATGIKQVVSHDSYLINLANPQPEASRKSRDLFREELVRCEMLDIPFLVMHPGAHLGEGEGAGLARIAASLDKIHADLPGYQTVTCLEITAGQGTNLGYRMEHLQRIIELVREPHRLAVCLDSAHLLEAGYDLTSKSGTTAMLKTFDKLLGLDMIKVWHLNDSKTPPGSRVDRHEHIGLGHVSLDAFEVIVRHARFKKVPKILETPKAKHPSGCDWDEVNLRALRKLAGKKPPRRAKGA